MPRVAVLGAGGMLGRAVVSEMLERGVDVMGSYRDASGMGARAFELVVGSTFTADDVPDCDYVVNCIGAIPQRGWTQGEMVAVNTVFPRTLCDAMRLRGTRVVHVTTDCVFSGRVGWYSEHDEHDAVDVYGVTKSQGEHPSAMNVRTSIVGLEPMRRGVSLLEWARSSGGVVPGYVDHIWNGVTTWELARILCDVVVCGTYSEGVHHVFSSEAVTKHRLLSTFARVFGLEVEVAPVRSGALVDRTLTSVRKLCEQLQVRSLEVMLDELRRRG